MPKISFKIEGRKAQIQSRHFVLILGKLCRQETDRIFLMLFNVSEVPKALEATNRLKE